MIIKSKSRKAQAEESRLRILDTALLVFSEKGFAQTTIKDLADAAGTSSGLIYHYFPGKEELLEAAVEQHSFLPQLRELLDGNEGKPCRDVLTHIATRFITLLKHEDKIVRIFLREGFSNARVQKVWANLSHEGISLLKTYIMSRIETGELKPHNAEITARCLFSIIFMFHFTDGTFVSSPVTNHQFIEDALDNLLQGIQNIKT
jgi:TetR/AcrR family transcriptional regulator, cholesterol catabolism regulator